MEQTSHDYLTNPDMLESEAEFFWNIWAIWSCCDTRQLQHYIDRSFYMQVPVDLIGR